MTDFELLSMFIALMSPVYAALWVLLRITQKNKDDIEYINIQMEKLLGCRYCKKGTDEI